ncbi:MAG: LCP family protein [Actinomycetota bacterium]|nr:LCP family protein [Actinomycetota bacterium]
MLRSPGIPGQPYPDTATRKINAAHAIGGNDLAVRTFEQFTGIPIDFYTVTDFDGFKPLIDYFGGVTTTG